MVKTRIILLIVSALLIWAIFLLPKVVVESERGLATDSTAKDAGNQEMHPPAPENVRKSIARLRARHQAVIGKEKSVDANR